MIKKEILDRIEDIDDIINKNEDKGKENVGLYLRALYELKKLELIMNIDYYEIRKKEAEERIKTEEKTRELSEGMNNIFMLLANNKINNLKNETE